MEYIKKALKNEIDKLKNSIDKIRIEIEEKKIIKEDIIIQGKEYDNDENKYSYDNIYMKELMK